MLNDISVKGVGFLSDDPMRVGTEFVMQLNDAAGEVMHFNCTVRRCEAGGIGGVSYVVGATFESFADPKTSPVEFDPEKNGRRRSSLLAQVVSIVRQLNPVRLFHHGFKRFDDYSSLDDTKWFRRHS